MSRNGKQYVKVIESRSITGTRGKLSAAIYMRTKTVKSMYPLARGQMAKVWATLVCPVCGAEMREVCMEDGEDFENPVTLDSYACDYCNIMVTYVSPQKYHEYKDVPANCRRYLIEEQ